MYVTIIVTNIPEGLRQRSVPAVRSTVVVVYEVSSSSIANYRSEILVVIRGSSNKF